MDTRSKEMHSKTEISITESYSSHFRLPLPYSFSVISGKSFKKRTPTHQVRYEERVLIRFQGRFFQNPDKYCNSSNHLIKWFYVSFAKVMQTCS